MGLTAKKPEHYSKFLRRPYRSSTTVDTKTILNMLSHYLYWILPDYFITI